MHIFSYLMNTTAAEEVNSRYPHQGITTFIYLCSWLKKLYEGMKKLRVSYFI